LQTLPNSLHLRPMHAEYPFALIEEKWRRKWAESQTFAALEKSSLPKFYVLDMFPYPSGAGLHVGHPLGYIASDIVARYKRNCGYNVLHPMGYDSFGLPAEQYAIQTGQHPAITTTQNIERYRSQLDKMGFSFDWSREVRTSDPAYYKHTQYIFTLLFDHWYDTECQKARPIKVLIEMFANGGNENVRAAHHCKVVFSAATWQAMSEHEQAEVLLCYRLAYLSDTMVNWCPALGTVLSNDEVKDGFSERGGHPVTRMRMKQWSLRITAYAQRLLDGLNDLHWSDSIKEAQRNWIGRSTGCRVRFKLKGKEEEIEVFTTRPDTIFGVSFIVLAPEHELVSMLTTADCKEQVTSYVAYAASRSERERQAETKKITGCFTGSYALHPFSGKEIPVWIGEYVLAGYGTGAVMAVPAGDQRDYDFARHFQLPVIPVIHNSDVSSKAEESKEGTMINSDFLNGLTVAEAIVAAGEKLSLTGAGGALVQYRLRDAIFGRQRYWGEPIPVYYRDGIPMVIPKDELPLTLPEVDAYLPTPDGEPPLARAKEFTYKGYPLEKSTMPGWAGSSWYFLRYMDPQNASEPASQESMTYWQQVDLYMGGSEHATGHLLYARFWTHFLYDLGLLPFQEPFKKLVNQGMIQGTSAFVYVDKKSRKLISKNLISSYDTYALHVDVNLVDNHLLDVEKFKLWRDEFKDVEFVLEEGKYICGSEVEKMSKSKWNVVNPDDVIGRYGADTLRMYEMFLGPLELSKPWNTNGITGVHGFLKKCWKLFHQGESFAVTDEEPVEEELRSLHKLIKKVREDIDKFSFNTSVSAFMICVNELTELACRKRRILEPLLVCLSPFAPHVCEELWEKLGYHTSIVHAEFPEFNEEFLVSSSIEYPVSLNGKTRFKMTLPASMDSSGVEQEVRASEELNKYLGDKMIKKVIVVPGRIVNVVHT
jgi:leucyl-tRNA synthetase